MPVKTVHGHITRHIDSAFLALVVDHLDPMARVRPAHAARFGWPVFVAVSHHVIDFRLAKHFVRAHAELFDAIVEHRVTNSLPCTHQGLQFQAKRLLNGLPGVAGKRLHHRLERRREQKGMRHTTITQQGKRGFRAEAAVVSDDRPAEIQHG